MELRGMHTINRIDIIQVVISKLQDHELLRENPRTNKP